MKNYQFLLCFFLCLGTFTSIGQENSEVAFESATAAYTNKSYSKAIDQYLAILAKGEHSKALYNNLGSSLYQIGNYPKSILYFEKGLKFDPYDISILHNLNLSREQLENDVVQIPEFVLIKAWKYMHTRLSSNTWFAFSLISLFGAVFAFSIWLLHKERQKKKSGFLGGIILFGLSILLFCLSHSQASFRHSHNTAIIMQEAVSLKSAPEEANEPIMTLEPGTKIFFIDEIGEYHKVKLDNGQLGWIPKGSFELI